MTKPRMSGRAAHISHSDGAIIQEFVLRKRSVPRQRELWCDTQRCGVSETGNRLCQHLTVFRLGVDQQPSVESSIVPQTEFQERPLRGAPYRLHSVTAS